MSKIESDGELVAAINVLKHRLKRTSQSPMRKAFDNVLTAFINGWELDSEEDKGRYAVLPPVSEEEFSTLLTKSLDGKDLSIKDITEDLAINQGTINRWKSGKATPVPSMRVKVTDQIKTIIERNKRDSKRAN